MRVAVITKIQVQKRNKSRFNLFLSRGKGEEYALSVDEDLLIKHGLKKGLELDEETLIQLIDEDEKKKAYFLAVNYLSYRMRSVKEISVYLQKKDKDPRHIEEVIKELIEKQLLNDLDFAQAFIRSKLLTLTKGPLKLKQELYEKGVDGSIIDQALNQYSRENQIETIVKWLEKQKKPHLKFSNRALKDKLSNQLLSKGFSHDVILEALTEVDLSNENDEEWEAICFQGEKGERKYKGKYSEWEFKQRMKQYLYRKGFAIDLIEKYIDRTE
jgi:regulatory protein